MYNITKEFDFCYGHRVHNQTLNADYSIDSCLVCRHLHGHQGKIIVNLTAKKLTNDMITDFKHLNFFKKWIDDTLDHKFIIDINDPIIRHIFPLIDRVKDIIQKQFESNSDKALAYLDPNYLKQYPSFIKEIYEGVVIVNFVPTSENLSKWLFDLISAKLHDLGIIVKSVTFKETPKTSAEYSI